MRARSQSGSLLFSSAVLLALVLIALTLVWWYSGNAGVATVKADGFERVVLGDSYFLNDMGLADINNDGWIDIYTTNHSNAGAVLINRGVSGFSFGHEESAGLHQDYHFPGLAPDRQRPEFQSDGLYMYFMDGALVCESKGGSATNLSGSIRIPWEIRVEQSGDMEVTSAQDPSAGGVPQNLVQFVMRGDSRLLIVPQPIPTLAFPFQVSLAPDTPLSEVFIGRNSIRPDAHQFQFTLRDRHGMAWADFDQDGDNDVFIGRGGIRGKMEQVWPHANDELLVAVGDAFHDYANELGIQKNNCPSRQVGWVDYDGDDRLDLYAVCGRTTGVTSSFPNQLYRQREDGKFTDVAPQAGVDIPAVGTFVWLDADGDGDQDMVWSEARSYYLYRNEQGRFSAEELGAPEGNNKHAARLAVSDFDLDGDLDIFSASGKHSVLLENTGASFRLLDTAATGLPGKLLTANWVDYDNDGRPDLHLVPGGLYRQQLKGQFHATGQLDFGNSKTLGGARTGWLDADKDGRMDLVLGVQFRPGLKRLKRLLGQDTYKPPRWKLYLFRNTSADGHWLQLDLPERSGHVAQGARVQLELGGRVYTAQVGQAEGSHYSQGHRRIYFGLGDNTGIGRLHVRWSDGTIQTVNDVRIDQIVTVPAITDPA